MEEKENVFGTALIFGKSIKLRCYLFEGRSALEAEELHFDDISKTDSGWFGTERGMYMNSDFSSRKDGAESVRYDK